MVSDKEIEARAVTAFVRALSEPGAAVGDQKPAIANVNINYVVRAVLSAAAHVRAEDNAEPVAWTGSWSLNALSHGYEGFIYPEETEAHPIPLFTHAAPQPSGAVHPDDLAVDRFATAMKDKLKWEREERGRYGWNDPSVCSEEYLSRLLVEHLAKGNEGNFEDIANLCMMLHQRGAHPQVLASALTSGKPRQRRKDREQETD